MIREELIIVRKGYTFVEVMVVVALVALLSKFVLPYINDYIQGGNISKVQSEMSAIANDIVRYKHETGQYPGSLAMLGADNGLYKAVPGYAANVNDPWGQSYYYQYNNTLGYAVWSGGPNRVNDSGNGYQGGLKNDDRGIVGK